MKWRSVPITSISFALSRRATRFAQIVTRFKSLSARTIFREFPRIKRRLWGGELWEDGYFVRTVGDKVTAEIIRRYIQYHQGEKAEAQQLNLFD